MSQIDEPSISHFSEMVSQVTFKFLTKNIHQITQVEDHVRAWIRDQDPNSNGFVNAFAELGRKLKEHDGELPVSYEFDTLYFFRMPKNGKHVRGFEVGVRSNIPLDMLRSVIERLGKTSVMFDTLHTAHDFDGTPWYLD
ncbi:hypothetical protein [Planctomycetes bacterium TBK1r]|uniref:Uncharacterized protein n=1 Tax=Stieleria magnilauensis TaxID=2527963 RepID=A0ABX5XIY7_9BACT|nr:hypothetical protein TBK1r_02810 [Planctomycetes bacterium TBK1r]